MKQEQEDLVRLKQEHETYDNKLEGEIEDLFKTIEEYHLKLELIQESQPYRHISSIAFNKAGHFEHIKNGNPIDICYSIVENYYRGIANIQLRIKDIHDREDFI